MANTMTSKQQAQAKQAVLDMRKEQAARPKTGVPGPYMPTMGPAPKVSPADKAKAQAELAKKVAANKGGSPSALPAPVQAPKPVYKPDVPAVKPTTPMEPVEVAKAKAQADMMAKQPTMPSPGMSSPGMSPKPTTPSPGYTGIAGSNTGAPGMAVPAPGMKRGGAVRSKPQTKFASGGSVGGASRRGDGIAQRGKTKGRMC